jgi:hypothetical protein
MELTHGLSIADSFKLRGRVPIENQTSTEEKTEKKIPETSAIFEQKS